MRKLSVVIVFVLSALSSFSQSEKEIKKKELLSRSGDHFMFQFSSDHWLGMPDSIKSHQKGFSRGVNVYVMYDKKFRANPRFSIAGGIGVSTSNIFFKKMNVDIGSNGKVLPFIATDTSNNYKKYKLTTAFLEVPIEFRFSSNPSTPNKSVKVALGMKFGTMLSAHTKAKTLRTVYGSTITNSTEKVTDKTYFNNTRIAATARLGYGNFTLFGAYNLASIFKDAVAEDIKLLQVGITISGL